MKMVNNERLEKEIRKNTMAERYNERTWLYHNKLMVMLQSKMDGSFETDKSMVDAYAELNDDFSYIVSMQSNMVQLSFDIAKSALEEAFNTCGFVSGSFENTNG